MPLYLDRHDVPGVTSVDLAMAHGKDVQIEKTYGVRYVIHWFDPVRATAFCLAEGPNAESVEAVHRDSHGLVASRIILVDLRSVGSFLGAILEPAVGEPFAHTAFRAILFTDICGSTALTNRLGDVGAMGLLRAHDAIVRNALESHGGSEVKHTGDGIMASFLSVPQAVACALEINHQVQERNREAKTELSLRIGISCGEAVNGSGCQQPDPAEWQGRCPRCGLPTLGPRRPPHLQGGGGLRRVSLESLHPTGRQLVLVPVHFLILLIRMARAYARVGAFSMPVDTELVCRLAR